MSLSSSRPVWALLAGASLWGVVWYPYRILAGAGLDGIWSTALTYGIALAVGAAIFRGELAALRRAPPLAIVMALAIGWSNLAYVLGVLEGEVMRVLLLFYLAPLWTVPVARIVLKERLDGAGLAAMALALAGAAVMLWHPELGLPWPRARSEWLGVLAGFLFAVGNVLVRRLDTMTDAGKSIAIWAGVTFAGLVHLPASGVAPGAAFAAAGVEWSVVAGVGMALVAMSLSLQYGLARLPANRAIVILLFELVVAALAAYLLAGESMGPREWIGGALIVAATLVSARPGKDA